MEQQHKQQMKQDMEVSGRKGFYCDPCMEDGTHNEVIEGFCEDCSDYLCADCYRIHRRPKLWRKHRLLDKTEIPKIRPAAKATENFCEEFCPEHPTKPIEYFCEYHRRLGCSVCMTLNHRLCAVDYIPKVSDNFIQTSEFKKFETELDKLKRTVNERHTQKKMKRSYLLNYVEFTLEDVKRIRLILKSLLGIMEIEVTELEAKRETDREYFEGILPKFDEMKDRLDHLRGDVSDKLEQKQYCQLFIAVKRNLELKSTIADSLDNLDFDPIPYTFGLYEECSNMFKNLCSQLDGIRMIPEESANNILGQGGQRIKEGSLSVVSKRVAELNARSDSDSESCEITAMVKISDDTIAISDTNNSCLKIVDLKTKELISRRVFSAPPYDIALVQSELAITCTTPRKGAVCIVTANGLKWIRGFFVGRGCRGIVYHNNSLFVCFSRTPRCVKEMDMRGQIINTFTATGPVQLIALYNMAFHEETKTLYVSDQVNMQVIRMSLDGDFLANLQLDGLKNIAGLAVSNEGILFVCDRENNIVHIIDATLKHKLASLGEAEGIQKPCGIVYSDTDQKLFIAMDNEIKVFKVFLLLYKWDNKSIAKRDNIRPKKGL